MNRFLLVIVFLLLISGIAHSQSFYGSQYFVQVPVNDSITSTPISDPGPGGCYASASFTVSFPSSKVAGIMNYMLITAVSPGNSVYTPQKGTLKVGDTLPFTSSYPSYDFYFPTGGGIMYTIKAKGSPKNEGEEYPCGQFIETTNAGGCPDVITYTFIQTGKVLKTTGSVSPVAVKMMPLVNLSETSYSTTATVTIDKSVVLKDGRFELYDTYGRKAKVIPVTTSIFIIDRKDVNNGTYFWKFISNTQTIGLGKVIITQQ